MDSIVLCFECGKGLTRQDKYIQQDVRSETGAMMRIRAHVECARTSKNKWPGFEKIKLK